MLKLVESDGGRRFAGFKSLSRKDSLVCALADFHSDTFKDEHQYGKWRLVVGLHNKKRRIKLSEKPLKEDVSVILEAAGFAKVTLLPYRWLTFSEAHEAYGDCIVVTTGFRWRASCLKGGRFYGRSDDDQMREKLNVTTGQFEKIERMTRQIWVKIKGEIR